MGVFKSSKLIAASPEMIGGIAKSIELEFMKDGYDVQSQSLCSGGYDISISKGGVFKAVLGMKSALKVNLQPQDGVIFVEAGVGIFGQQAIPTALSMLFLWPVLLTQIWGMVQQAKLDEKVICIAELYVAKNQYYGSSSSSQSGKFCTSCGSSQSAEAAFCNKCGGKI